VIVLLAAALLSAGVGSERPVVVMTPEAVGSPAPPAWVGAVIAEELPRALACRGVAALTWSDRLRAQEVLALPGGRLSLASSIHLSEAVGASHLVLGQVEQSEQALQVALRVVDLHEARLAGPVAAGGDLERLSTLIAELARGIARELLPKEAAAPPACWEPASSEALRWLGEGLAGIGSEARARCLARAVDLAPGLPSARLALARQLASLGDTDAALRQLAAVPDASPAAGEARFLAGVVALQAGRASEAAEVFGRLAASGSPEPALLNDQAVALRRAGDASGRAIGMLRRAAEAAPGAITPAFNLARALLDEGASEEAAFWARGVLQKRPHDAEARLLLERATHPGPPPAGPRPLPPERLVPSERLLELDADQDANQDTLLLAHLDRAEALLAAGRHQAAAGVLQRAAYLDPFSGRAHRLMARAYRAQGELELALGELRMALFCHSEPAVQMELAETLWELGLFEEARRHAQSVLRVDPENAEARRILGDR
jgi:tetratricopeptide (TPR) repeat protein